MNAVIHNSAASDKVRKAIEHSEKLVSKLLNEEERKNLEKASETAAINFDCLILSVLAQKYNFNKEMLSSFFDEVSALAQLRDKTYETRIDYIPETELLRDTYGFDVPGLYGRDK